MKIQVAEPKDIAYLSRFYQYIIKDNPYYSRLAIKEELKRFSARNLRKEFKDKDNLYIFIKEGDKIIGARNGYYEAGMFWSDWGIAHPLYRRKGISRALMTFLEKKLKKEGVHKIWCDSRTNNKESISALKKLGFKKIVTIKNHWYKQDFILWQKLLN